MTHKQFTDIVCKRKVCAFAYVEVQCNAHGKGRVQYELFFKEGITREAYAALLKNVLKMLHELKEACGENLGLVRKRPVKHISFKVMRRGLNGYEH